ncbi:hypothetical protein BcFMB_03855 [Bifidobacterium choerinum]|uniref:Uncharacterized protein n=1 Tax=Bifidobacterium choerinum TaxID=35760 RepID=A0A2D3D537_9BIFI|nr:hypothetical protein BcFMB_03855 [Bifidobacterium choerinum]
MEFYFLIALYIDDHRCTRLNVLEFENQTIGILAIEIGCIHVKYDGGVLIVLTAIKYDHLLFIIRIERHPNANIRRSICAARSFSRMELPRIILLTRISVIKSILCGLIDLHT